MIREALGPWNKPPITVCEIHIERHSPGIPDPDAIVAKPLLDALVVCTKRNPHGLGIIYDDNPDVIRSFKVDAIKGKRGAGKTIVMIGVVEQ